MATPNYGYEKRQKELAKKRKKEEKLKRKSEPRADEPLEGDDTAATPGDAPAPGADDPAGNPPA